MVPTPPIFAGVTWDKARAGCYVRPLPGTRLKLVLLRRNDNLWTANVKWEDRGTLLWKSGAVANAADAAALAVAWVAERDRAFVGTGGGNPK